MGASLIVSNEDVMKILAENEKSGKHSPTLFQSAEYCGVCLLISFDQSILKSNSG